MTPADYALQAVKGIKKSFDNAIRNKIEEYMDNRVIDFYNTDEISEIFTSTEGLSGSKKLGDLETPPTLKLEDGYSVTLTEERFGGAIEIPEKAYRRDGKDNTLKVQKYLQKQRNQLLKDNVYLLVYNAFLMLNEAFDSTSDYLAPDGVELIGVHNWASGGSFTNLASGNYDEDAADTLEEYASNFEDPSGKPMPLDFDILVVKKGSANARMAKRLHAFGISPIAVADINIYVGEKIIVETPYITTANKNAWFSRCSMQENSVAVGIGEFPTMREPIRQNNEAIRSNVTGFWKQGIINMPYDWYGSPGA